MKDLSSYVNAVYAARSLELKKEKMREMIEASHAKKETKKLAFIKLEMCRSADAINKFATNYMFSGEGLKV